MPQAATRSDKGRRGPTERNPAPARNPVPPNNDTEPAPAEPAPAEPGAQPAHNAPTSPVNAAIADPPPRQEPTSNQSALTTVDRYHLAWTNYQTDHGHEPTAEQLSAYLAAKGIHNRNGKSISPANLRRYLLASRVYTVWAEHRTHNEQPDPDAVAHACTTRNITGQYNKPITADYITHNTPAYQRRWHALTHHHISSQQ
jgi:hypothetical protein